MERTFSIDAVPNIGERYLDGGGGLVSADEGLVGGVAHGATQREDDGHQHRRLPAPFLAAQEVQPLVRHKSEFLREKKTVLLIQIKSIRIRIYIHNSVNFCLYIYIGPNLGIIVC